MKRQSLPARGSAAQAHLSASDPAFAALIGRIGPCRLRHERGQEPYEALVRAVAYQQLHARAAEAILGRVLALFPDHAFPPPDLLLAVPDAAMRAAGLSAGKLASIRDICGRTLDGVVPTRRAALRLPDEELIARLSTLRGVGRWTVEMLLIFTLGRPDVLPVDDFGVRDGWRHIQGMDKQPAPRELAAIGAAWAPHRSAAAWYLWRAAEEAKQAALRPKKPPARR